MEKLDNITILSIIGVAINYPEQMRQTVELQCLIELASKIYGRNMTDAVKRRFQISTASFDGLKLRVKWEIENKKLFRNLK